MARALNMQHIDTQGFSLLEVLVSLVIIAVSLVVVFQTLSGATQLAVRREQLHEALRIAQGLLDDAELLKEAVVQTSLQDAVRNDPDWLYHIQATPLRIQLEDDLEALEVPAMHQLEVCVFEGNVPAARRLCLQTWYRES